MALQIDAKRILVIQLRAVGDVILTTPLLRALRQHYPGSYIAFLTEPASAQVLRGNPCLDEVLIRPRHAPWRQDLQFFRRLRRLRFDLVIDAMGNPRSAVMTWVSGARHRVAFKRFPRSLCYTMLVDQHYEVQDYTVAKRLRLLEPLGIQATDLSLFFTYTEQDREEVSRFLQAHGITPEDLLICIDPTSYVPTRQWPGEHYSQLADLLSEQLGARVLLLWGPGEQEQVQTIAAASRSNPLLIPAWELAPLAALLARADLLVGSNSAPLHVAVSQRTPSLTIFGATDPVSWLPPEPWHRAVRAGLPCQPCNQVQCGPPLHIACLRTLPAETVLAAVRACAPWVPKLSRRSSSGYLAREDDTIQ
jgi:heptosyltransferase-3